MAKPKAEVWEPVVWTSFGVDLCAGVDEVGRGCLAGPVYASAVILPPDFELPGLTDSKLLTPELRKEFAGVIKAKAVAWAIGIGSLEEIAKLNILHASMLAMKRAVEKLGPVGLVLVDGNRPIPGLQTEQKTFVKGDLRCLPISAASVVAKVERDELMARLDREFPGYGLAEHKGYGTPFHRKQIALLGPTIIHRAEFAGVKEYVVKNAQGQRDLGGKPRGTPTSKSGLVSP